MPQVRNKSGEPAADPRHVPLDRKSVLDKCSVWVTWVNSNRKVAPRDMKRICEALDLLANTADQKSYTCFLRQAQACGGKELVAILALAVGKAAFREMRQQWKRTIPAIVAEQRWHQSDQVRQLVRSLEHPAAEKGKCIKPTDAADASITRTNDEAATSSTSMGNGTQPIEAQDPMLLQQLTSSFASESLYTPELAGSVYELAPMDILEIATALVTQKLEGPGQLLMTEPFLQLAQPFVFIPITQQLCAYFREQRQRIM
ncbi:hypothetical protein DV738_g1632, partial [Chaetothyriales sp. CBS 135597]